MTRIAVPPIEQMYDVDLAALIGHLEGLDVRVGLEVSGQFLQ
jgi:hypothetical protein